MNPLRASSRPLLVLALLVLAPLGAEASETWVSIVPPPKGGAAAPSSVAPAPGPTASTAPTAPTAKGKKAKPGTPPPAAIPVPKGAVVAGDSGLVDVTTGRFPVGEAPIRPERIDRTYIRIGSGGGRPMPLTGARVEGSATRLDATYAGIGLAAVAVQLVPEPAERKAEEFEAFLSDSGCSSAQEERKKKKETKKAARVVTISSAKTFLLVVEPRAKAPASTDGGSDPIPMPLAIVVEGNPLAVAPGTPFNVTLLRDGQPAPDAALRLYADGAASPALVRTGPDGKAALVAEKPGPFLLAAATVRRTVKDDRKKGEAWKKADWEVATTTLRLEAAVPPPPPAPTPVPTATAKPAKKPKKK